jgi:tetratricopeptide (TPR) repeat protein
LLSTQNRGHCSIVFGKGKNNSFLAGKDQVKIMNFLKYLIIVLLIFINVLSAAELLSQGVKQKPTRQSSMEAFSKGDYERAYGEFSELLKTYSKDPLYKYYSAVCLVKLERDPENAVDLMQEALKNNTTARPLPADATFYLGRAQHLNGSYNDAIASYNKYSDQAGRKAAREQSVPDFIQQCSQEKGALEKIEEKPVEKVTGEIVTSSEPATEVVVAGNVTLEKMLPAREDLPAEYSEILEEALSFQFLSDSVNTLVTEKKQQLEKLPNDMKPAAKSQIAEYELLASTYQKSADQKYSQAHIAMNPDDHKPDEILQKTDNRVIKSDELQQDTLVDKVPSLTDVVEIYYYFKILDKPVTDAGAKIQIDPEVPQGLIYRIQVAVFRNPVSPIYFKGITPVYGFRAEGSDLKTYYAGMFRRLSDARDALTQVKGKGFRDSFVASFMGRKSVSADRAVVLERVVNKISVVVPADTLPPTLTFRVEVMRVTKPVKPAVIESMKTLAGSRGIDILTVEDKKIAYLIGNFITFDSAAEYADLIVRNGYRDAKVVAWLGSKEIPVETAKQIFETLK